MVLLLFGTLALVPLLAVLRLSSYGPPSPATVRANRRAMDERCVLPSLIRSRRVQRGAGVQVHVAGRGLHSRFTSPCPMRCTARVL